MLLEVLKYPHPVLKQKAEPVLVVTPEIRELAENMLETMYENDGIGLAAPQVGELKRMVVIDVTGPDAREAPMVLINPEVARIGEDVESEEGCLSVEEYRNTLIRSDRVRLKATDLDGKPVELEAEDILAVCLQHECDHLDGILFIDHLSRLKRSLYDSKVKKRLKAKNG
ncbi:peptide deformylase [Desulfovibrio sp. OttesenSCG-928-I05]|nr:peptide deformylase [Desulfovibrio sp. OttesenSCG-928-I05]